MIDVAGGDKVPRKGGPGTRNADLLLINKVDLAPLVGADLAVMRRDAEARRQGRPTVLTNLRAGSGVDTVRAWVVEQLLRHEQAPAHIHSILVQVRGGLVEGDRWRLSALARGGAQAHLRAAGATIVYSGTCFVRTTLCASDGGSLTQRSSGLILRPGASLRAATVIRADAGGTVVATEVIALAEGCGGTLRSVVVRDATPLFEERIGLSEDRSRPWRLGEFSHLGSLIAVGLTRQRRLRALLRDLPPSAGASSPRPGCLLVRALGHSIDELDSLLGGLLEEARG